MLLVGFSQLEKHVFILERKINKNSRTLQSMKYLAMSFDVFFNDVIDVLFNDVIDALI
jgi:hypothetical protein